MKKTILFASAAIAALAFTSCNNELDPFMSFSSEKATINLNVANDILMTTRASSEITDYSKWYVKVSPKAVGSTAQGTTEATGWLAANVISTQSFKPGGYAIEVTNYKEDGEAYAVNSSKGDAYYVGSVDKALLKGPNAVTIDCGQAKNCRVSVDFSGLSGVTTIPFDDINVTLQQAGRGITTTNSEVVNCPDLVNGEKGYFKAGVPITYQLNYKYMSDPTDPTTKEAKHSTPVTISAPAEHTEYQIVATSNSNGTITLTIKCDGVFDSVAQPTITIDAATGAIQN